MDKVKKFFGISILGLGVLFFIGWTFFIFSLFMSLEVGENDSMGIFIPFVINTIKNYPVLMVISVLLALFSIFKIEKKYKLVK